MLLERKQEEERRTFGRLCAVVANFTGFGEKKKALTAEDFYPDHKQSLEGQDIEHQITFLAAGFGCGPNNPGTYDPKHPRTIH